MRGINLLVSLSFITAAALTIAGQGVSASLHSDTRIERTLSTGQTHTYTINLEKDQYLQLAIEQRGVDVVVRVFLPDGKLLREFDSPTGAEGVESVEVIAESAGTYRVEVSPLDDAEASAAGRYEIKVVELRNATEDELRIRRNKNTRKAKGLALLIETSQKLDQFHLPETRVDMLIKVAQLLWKSDEKKASALIGQAMETVQQVVADNAERETDYAETQLAMRMRLQVINALAPHDPEAALKFFHATRGSNDIANRSAPEDPELQLESSLLNHVVAADPKRAFELAEDMLNRTSSALLIETLTSLAAKDRTLAGRLASDMTKKVQGQELIKNADAAFLAGRLLQIVRTPQGVKPNGDATQKGGLLSDDEFRDLFLKVLSELLSYSQPAQNTYPPEFMAVRNLANVITQMAPEVKVYAPDRADATDRKIAEITGSVGQPTAEWQRYQTAVTNAPVETALESVAQAPVQMRDFLYQQVANRIATAGDVPRARQIVVDRISNPSQRKQALYVLQSQAVTSAAEQGRFDEALRLLSKFRPGPERTNLINQILDYFNSGVKKSQAVQYLEQAKNLVTTSIRAEDDNQMETLLAIARALAPHDVNRSFQIAEPLIDQFNEMSAAAITMNGFGQQYYRDGELITSNQNPVAAAAGSLADTLATLAMFDFDRAKRATGGIIRFEARLRAQLAIAERTMEIHLESDEADDDYPRER